MPFQFMIDYACQLCCFMTTKIKMLLVVLLFMLSLLCRPFHAGEICPSANIKNKVSNLEILRNCSVIEGSLVISMIAELKGPNTTVTKMSFPMLREITDYFVLFGADQINSLRTLFPNLAVIRGNTLIKNYALMIYRNAILEQIGLVGLTNILRGGIRIEKNPSLCYVDTVDWKAIVDTKFHNQIHITENEVMNACPDFCPYECLHQNCWNEDSCQTHEIGCPSGIIGRCFNRSDGQLENCASECLGGCFKMNESGQETSSDCVSCKEIRVNDIDQAAMCRPVCPSHLLKFNDWRCIHEAECTSVFKTDPEDGNKDENIYVVYKDQCLNGCPPETRQDGGICVECVDCPKKCFAGWVTSLEELQSLEGCTEVADDLILHVSGDQIVEELERSLSRIKTIKGILKIARSYPIVSLSFFKNLRTIQGNENLEVPNGVGDKYYSLYILENENLQHLFPILPDGGSVQIYQRPKGASELFTPGRAFIHYNPNLCPTEIQRQVKVSGLVAFDKDSADVSLVTNGDKAVCSHKRLDLNILAQSRVMTVEFSNYVEEIAKEPTANTRALLSYEIHYREISREVYLKQNLSKYEGRDACGGDAWHVSDFPPSEQVVSSDGQFLWPKEIATISYKLKPFHYYAVFVTTLMTKDVVGSENIPGAQSDIKYIQMEVESPSVPTDVSVNVLSSSSVEFSWKPPLEPYGVLHHYDLVLEIQDINRQRIMERPFCIDPHKVDKVDAFLLPSTFRPPIVDHVSKNQLSGKWVYDWSKNGTSGRGRCDCTVACGDFKRKKNTNYIKRIKATEEARLEENAFFDALINSVFIGKDEDIRTNRDIRPDQNEKDEITAPIFSNVTSKDNVNSFLYKIDDGKTRYEIIHSLDSFLGVYRPYSVLYNGTKQNPFYTILSVSLPANLTKFRASLLKHFGRYQLQLRACHAPKNTEVLCSTVVSKDFITQAKVGADDIISGLFTVNQLDTSELALVQWVPPAEPNELIIKYNLEIVSYLNGERPGRFCITAKEFELQGNVYRLSMAGSFFVRVQAVSLAGPGNWTKWTWVHAPRRYLSLSSTVLLCCLAFLLLAIMVAAFFIFWRKKLLKKRSEDIISGNPNYHWTGPNRDQAKRIADDWEVPRSSVVYDVQLGNGAFGMVYKGVFTDPETAIEIPCAVKRITNEEIDGDILMKEAGVMKRKDELDRVHVVKLLGVVSDMHPNLVIMELMTKGDLKTYLRRLRPDAEIKSDQPPPTYLETLLMALQIADGMSYLAFYVRIVHRDLAARNCLVTENNVVKIGDFGMAREIYMTDYYRKNDRGMMPVRWMSPESLRDGLFTISSDVWSFGVVLWEMVTLAELPYQGLSNTEVLRFVLHANIMAQPLECPPLLYKIMRLCWCYYGSDRPNFLNICSMILPLVKDARFERDSYIFSKFGKTALLEEEAKGTFDPNREIPHVKKPLETNSSEEEVGRNLDEKIVSFEMQDFLADETKVPEETALLNKKHETNGNGECPQWQCDGDASSLTKTIDCVDIPRAPTKWFIGGNMKRFRKKSG